MRYPGYEGGTDATEAAVQILQRQRSNPVLSEPVARSCYRYGGMHASDTCHFKETGCYLCHKGHLARVCRSKAEQPTTPGPRQRHRGCGDPTSGTHTMQVEEEGGGDPAYSLFQVRGENNKTDPIEVLVQVCGASLEMEVDSGASCSIISEATYRHLWLADQAPPLYPTQKKLYTYTG